MVTKPGFKIGKGNGVPKLTPAQERARRSVAEFRKLLPTLSAYARNLTGKKNVKVVMDAHSNGHTDGTSIFLRPPISLGDIEMMRHDKSVCDKRDPVTLAQMCPACETREDILATVYHEISHIAFDSFLSVGTDDVQGAIEMIHQSAPKWYYEAVQKRLHDNRWAGIDSFFKLAHVVNPYFKALVNGLEDTRINERMAQARPGTRIMQKAKTYKVAIEGVEQKDKATGRTVKVRWSEYDQNMQASIGLFCVASGYDIEGWFSERVQNALLDAEVQSLCKDVPMLPTAKQVFGRSFEIFMRMREFGFFVVKDEELPAPPEPADEPEPPAEEPEEKSDESSDVERESEGTDDTGDGGDDDSSLGGRPDGDDGAADAGDDSEGSDSGDAEGSESDSGGADGGESSDADGGDESPGRASNEADAESDGSSDGSSGDTGPRDSDSDGTTDPEQADGEGGPVGSQPRSDSGGGSEADQLSEDESPAGKAVSDGSDAEATVSDDSDDGADSPGEQRESAGSDGEAGESGGDSGSSNSGGSSESELAGNDSSGSSESDAKGDGGQDDGGPSDAGTADGSPAEEQSHHGSHAHGSDEADREGDSSPSDSNQPVDGSVSDDGGGEEEGAGESSPGEGEGESESDDTGAGDQGRGEASGDGNLTPDPLGTGTDEGQSERGDGGPEGVQEDGDSGADQGSGPVSGPNDGSEEYVEPLDYKPEEAVDATAGEERKIIPPTIDSDTKIELVDMGLHEEHADPSFDQEAEIESAIVQGVYFEMPSSHIGGLRVWKFADRETDQADRMWHAWGPGFDGYYGQQSRADIDVVGEQYLGPALMKLRVAFSDNRRAKHNRNQRAGRIDTRALGKRAWGNDDRLFGRKVIPSKKDYFVVIGLDVSGSTRGVNIKMIKEAALAQAELCQRLGVKFAVYAHTGGPLSVDRLESRYVDMYEIKAADQPWDNTTRQALMEIGPSAANLDGHTLEFYRKLCDTEKATNKVILYYSDGAMPLENYHEELEILQREIATCRQKKITLLGVGVRTDSPTKHGLDTVQIDDSSQVGKVVAHLERALIT